jgi:hypothetical protein
MQFAEAWVGDINVCAGTGFLWTFCTVGDAGKVHVLSFVCTLM